MKSSYFGEDVGGDKGGVFGVTKGLALNTVTSVVLTPLTEGLIGGLAVGLGLMGYRAIGEFQLRITFCCNQSIVIRGSDNALQNKRRLDCADRLSDPLWRRCSWWAVSFSVYRKSFCGQPGLRVVTPLILMMQKG